MYKANEVAVLHMCAAPEKTEILVPSDTDLGYSIWKKVVAVIHGYVTVEGEGKRRIFAVCKNGCLYPFQELR